MRTESGLVYGVVDIYVRHTVSIPYDKALEAWSISHSWDELINEHEISREFYQLEDTGEE